MGGSEPSVGVIMTCFNEGPWIGDAVRSVLDQTRADLIGRIVIADDGSNPATCSVLRQIEGWDPRIQVIYGSGGVGLPGQRNLAASHIVDPVLAILDGDDLWTPDKLARQIPALADPDVGLVYSDYWIFSDGRIEHALRGGVQNITRASDLARAYFLNDPPIVPSTALIRRSVFEDIGGFDPSVRVFEDTDFYLRIAKAWRFSLVDVPVLYKRAHPASITGGRRDLMAHHAFVALKAAAEQPRLLALVPRRLAERARKLGNQRYLLNDPDGAIGLLRLATRMDGWNLKAWGSLLIACVARGAIGRLLSPWFQRRRMMMGVVAP